MSSVVQQIKDRLNIEEVVSWYVTLLPSGNHLKAKSPFSQEKTPSFFVSPDKGLFYCFSTGKGGDLITFIQEIEGLEFKQAIEFLASKSGIVLDFTNTSKTSQKVKDQKNILSIANKFYQVNLRKSLPVVKYLTESRGLTKELIVKFQIGYAPDEYHMTSLLNRKKVSLSTGFEAGLLIPNNRGGYFDRFRSRIMFPISLPTGEVVGFTGRHFTLTSEDGDEKPVAKYLNSPETELFHKSKVLYGYHLARQAIMNSKQVVLVEGQIDVIMSHQAGVENCVGVSGTALSDVQISLIKRFADEVIIALDSDRAGISASEKIALLLYKSGLQVKAVYMPKGQDPADFILQQGETAWLEKVRQAVSFVRFRLEASDLEMMDKRQQTTVLQKVLFPIIKEVQSEVQKDIALSEVSEFLGVSHEALRMDFNKFTNSQGFDKGDDVSQDSSSADSFLLKFDLAGDWLAGIYYWLSEKSDNILLEKLVSLVSEFDMLEDWDKLLKASLDKKDTLMFSSELLFGAKYERIDYYIEMLIKTLALQKANKSFSQVLSLLKKSEQDNNEQLVLRYQKEAGDLSRLIQRLKSELAKT